MAVIKAVEEAWLSRVGVCSTPKRRNEAGLCERGWRAFHTYLTLSLVCVCVKRNCAICELRWRWSGPAGPEDALGVYATLLLKTTVRCVTGV